MKTLLIPNKSDSERDAVARAWVAAGGKIVRVDRFWERPSLEQGEAVAIYGNDTFALVLAQVLGLKLETPDDTLIARLAPSWSKRKVLQMHLGELDVTHFPCFVKPVIPKQFKALVYPSLADLQTQTQNLGDSEGVLVSEIVAVEAEARAFVLDGRIQSAVVYDGSGDLQSARIFMDQFAQEHTDNLPAAYVVDAGYNSTLGWFVMEFNSAWGAGLNGCVADQVIACIARATGEI